MGRGGRLQGHREYDHVPIHAPDTHCVAYTAPEILKHSEFDERSDVYSFGVVMFTALALVDDPFPEFAGLSNDDFVTRIVWEQHRPDTTAIDADVAALLKRCWDADVKTRPSMAQVIGELDTLLLHQSIADELGREFWAEAFGDKVHYLFIRPLSLGQII